MKFSCEKNLLQDACSISTRAVPAKSPMASLEGLKIDIKDDQVTITGYDLKKAIYTTLDADTTENGSILVNSRFFSEMLRRMPDGILTLECDEKNNVYVKCGKSEYNFPGLDMNEYPEMPQFDPTNTIEIPEKILKSMINRTIFAVAKDEIRPIYTGTLFEIENNEITLVSVDGYRLARKIEKIKSGKIEDCRFVVPGFSLTDIEKICDDVEKTVKIAIGEKHISFEIGKTVVITRRLEGDFLNHRKSVPEAFRFSMKINRQQAISAIERVSLVLSDSSTTPVKMTFEDGIINCLCASPLGRAEDTFTCEGDGEGLQIGFNDRYLLDALKAAETDDLQLCANTPSSPCVIKAADGSDNFTYMILPVRLRGN